MNRLLEVVDSGFGNCIQDGGRTGYRSIGVPVAGAADGQLLACANLLVGNEADAAGIEVALSGPSLKALSGPVRCALAGQLRARLTSVNGSTREVAPWETVTLFEGDTLAVGTSKGPGYIALSGGVRVPPQLGSRATYARAGLGGIDGRALRNGDQLPCGSVSGDPWIEQRAAAYLHPEGPLRVIAGPQADHFTPEALDRFLTQIYTVTPDMDRMGVRLEGPTLTHRPDMGADILSDGITPGAIQVPANGQPILLGPDCQTVGGYAKIATLISADLPRLAHLAPGQSIRFAEVDLAQAQTARKAQRECLAQWRSGITTFRPPGIIDEAALYSQNLLSGIIDGRDDDGDAP